MHHNRSTHLRGAALLYALAAVALTAVPAAAQRDTGKRPGSTAASADTVPTADTAPTADTKPKELQTITVLGTRANDAAPPVSTIDVPAERLLRTPSTNAYDLVRRATGIEVHEQGQGPGFASDAVIRGFSSDHSSDVLLTIDGVPINLPLHGHVEGYADWSI